MFLSYLSRKEKLKFLDLAIYMADIDGEPTNIEKRICKKKKFDYFGDLSEYGAGRDQYFVIFGKYGAFMP